MRMVCSAPFFAMTISQWRRSTLLGLGWNTSTLPQKCRWRVPPWIFLSQMIFHGWCTFLYYSFWQWHDHVYPSLGDVRQYPKATSWYLSFQFSRFPSTSIPLSLLPKMTTPQLWNIVKKPNKAWLEVLAGSLAPLVLILWQSILSCCCTTTNLWLGIYKWPSTHSTTSIPPMIMGYPLHLRTLPLCTPSIHFPPSTNVEAYEDAIPAPKPTNSSTLLAYSDAC